LIITVLSKIVDPSVAVVIAVAATAPAAPPVAAPPFEAFVAFEFALLLFFGSASTVKANNSTTAFDIIPCVNNIFLESTKSQL
jgi:hypothetical protein